MDSPDINGFPPLGSMRRLPPPSRQTRPFMLPQQLFPDFFGEGGDRETLLVAIPTRGTVFTGTLESVFRNIDEASIDFDFEFTTKPIPIGFNELFEIGRRKGSTYIWLVEDDMVMPPKCLSLLLNLVRDIGFDLSVPHYPLDTKSCHLETKDDEVLWGGTGCLLVKTESLERMSQPFFSTEFSFDKDLRKNKSAASKKWGGQDVYFYRNAIDSGLHIGVAPIRCSQLRLEALGDHADNHGLHKIRKIT